jgi:hypothetical protein
MISMLRILVRAKNPRELVIRLGGLLILVTILVVWGINAQSGLPPSGIAGLVTATPYPPLRLGEIELGQAVSESLSGLERHEYVLRVNGIDAIDLILEGDWASVLEVIPLTGADWTRREVNPPDSEVLRISNLNLDRNGTYQIRISGDPDRPGFNFGDYTLRIDPSE